MHRMTVVIDKPPLFDEIDAVFPVAGRPILFAFGDRIYNPMGVTISEPLMLHEAVHGGQQGDDPLAWWRKYLTDRRFRIDMEIPAHQAEYAEFCKTAPSRHHRQVYLKHRAKTLSGPLYGNVMSFENAKLAMKGKTAHKWQLQNS